MVLIGFCRTGSKNFSFAKDSALGERLSEWPTMRWPANHHRRQREVPPGSPRSEVRRADGNGDDAKYFSVTAVTSSSVRLRYA